MRHSSSVRGDHRIYPKHNRVYIWLGREFVVLNDQQALKYMDTGEIKEFEYQTVNGEKPKSKGKDRSR